MFTGIVETIGVVSELKALSEDGGTSLTISECASILGDCTLGDSISVNGTCLTVTSFEGDRFRVGVAPETLRRTNLGALAAGSRVNIERAVAASTRMGGHFVQGHVDSTATILSVQPDGNALTFRFRPRDPAVLRYVVEKGFVTIDGASLTVTKVHEGDADAPGWWEVMLIAYTQERVVTAAKKAGDEVNVEVDQIGKYVERAVEGYFSKGSNGDIAILQKMVERMVDAKLQKEGK